jgi:hypothetical protein
LKRLLHVSQSSDTLVLKARGCSIHTHPIASELSDYGIIPNISQRNISSAS